MTGNSVARCSQQERFEKARHACAMRLTRPTVDFRLNEMDVWKRMAVRGPDVRLDPFLQPSIIPRCSS